MALVRNNANHTVTLTVGTLAPKEERNIDVSGSYETQLVAAGVLTVIDPAQVPPAPAEPLASTARRTFFASAQPVNLALGDIWFKTDATTGKVLDVLEVTA